MWCLTTCRYGHAASLAVQVNYKIYAPRQDSLRCLCSLTRLEEAKLGLEVVTTNTVQEEVVWEASGRLPALRRLAIGCACCPHRVPGLGYSKYGSCIWQDAADVSCKWAPCCADIAPPVYADGTQRAQKPF